MYVENKVKYLRQDGWDVHVFYYIYGENYKLPVLKEYMENYIHDFMYSYHYVPKYRRNKILYFISKKVGIADEIIVESQLLTLACWGELIAEKLKGIHIVNFLEEQVPHFTEKEFHFFEFKLKRWEMMNAGPKSLKRVFKERLNDELLKYQHPMRFQCSNVVDESVVYEGSFAESNYTILSIGRLDKNYILPMVEEIRRFAEQHTDRQTNVFFVGGSLDGSKEKVISEMLAGLGNLNCYIMGYMFPVPSNILKMTDVAIACANSVLVTANYGIPTIVADMNDSYAIGVYGYTTQNNFSRREEPKTDISFWLNEVLVECRYPKHSSLNSDNNDIDEEFDRQVRFLEKSKGNKGYYDVDSIHGRIETIICNFKWFLHEEVSV